MSAALFQGLSVKILKDQLKFKTGTLIISGNSADPTSVAIDAPISSLYLRAGTSEIYQKLDSGSSTNWQLLGNTLGVASSTDNSVVRFDGTTGKTIQDSLVTIDDSGNIATSGTVDGRDVSADGTTLDTHLNGGTSKHDANEIDYERADGSKKNIQATSDDVEAAVSDLDDAVGSLAATPANYTPSNAAIVSSHLAAIDAEFSNVLSTINMLEFQDSVLSATVLTPPGSPVTGDRYLINGTGLVAWASHDNEIAQWSGSAWIFTSPTTGMFVGSDAEPTILYLYGGASWSAKYFEATTASGFLSKTGFDIQLTNLNSQNIIIGSAGNAATSVDTSSVGDISATTSGGLEIKSQVIVDGDISLTAAIAQSKLNLSITNNEVDAAAAIARTKIANGTASHVVINDGSGTLSSEATLAKVRGGSGQDNSSLTFPASGTLATLTGTETLTNKTLTSPTLTTPQIDVQTLIEQSSTPATPSSGYKKLYAKNDGKIYTVNSSGVVVEVLTSVSAYTAPTIQKFTSGSGTYTTPANVLYLKIKMVGGGGGGGAGQGGSSGGDGGNTTFGTTLLVANAGTKGFVGATSLGVGGNGGTASLGTGPIGIALTGAAGNGGGYYPSGAVAVIIGGGAGGSTPFGGAGRGGQELAGADGITNTGSGGGGGSTSAINLQSGGGGGAGGYVEAIIASPSATYSYAVGAGGAAGSSGSSGLAGGPGGSGVIIVEEHYQ